MYDDLKIIFYPDPRLKKPAETIQTFDEDLKALAERMFELMREAKGVGLAAPQVGIVKRLFVMNHTGEPEDDRVYINPELSNAEGAEEDEEGCLSLPGLRTKVIRPDIIRIKAQDIDGNPIDEVSDDFRARVWQHETDHLNGVLLIDRMGPVAKMLFRKQLREMEEKYIARLKN